MEPSDEDKLKKKISMGPALLKPMEEKDHYGLYRPLYIDFWNDEVGKFQRMVPDDPIGPLAVFRPARRGETVHMRTVHPTTQQQLELTCVEDFGTGTFIRDQEFVKDMGGDK